MSDEWNLGIELVPRVDDAEPDGQVATPGLADASREGESRIGRVRTAVVLKAREAVEQAAEDIGRQIGVMARHAAVGLGSASLDETRYVASQVQLTFGVKLTGGSGRLTEAFVTAGGEAQVAVVVTLDRTSR